MPDWKEKCCPRCQAIKPISDFGPKAKGGSQSYCRSCLNSYSKEYYRLHKPTYIARANQRIKKIKIMLRAAKDKPCADCGQNYPYYVMEFDHRVGEIKRFTLAKVASSQRTSLGTLLAEIEKCDVVCANCHRERTHRRKQAGLKKINGVVVEMQ